MTTSTVDEEVAPAVPRPPRGRISRSFLVLGELLITFGMIVFLFIFYELVVTNWATAATQHRLSQQLATQWQKPLPVKKAVPGNAAPAAIPLITVPAEGKGFAIIRIPRFGSGYHWVVVEGVGYSDLDEGPGHYPGTAVPGQVGNMVISGHRTTHGEPFNRLAELQVGDAISLQVQNHTYVYRMIRRQIVDPNDTSVIFPVPGNLYAKPTKKLLTLTTCNPEYSAAQRMVIVAELTGAGS